MVAAEGTEGALGRADVRVIDVPIDDVRAVVSGVHPLAHGAGPGSQVVQRSVVVDLQRLRIGEARLARDDRIDVERQLAHAWKTRSCSVKSYETARPEGS